MPKKRVSNFVIRTGLLSEIDKRLFDEIRSTTNVVLLGMGGSGKTQLALECCRRAKTMSNFIAVIWIDASSPLTVAQSYKTVAQKVTGGLESTTNIEDHIAIVEEALQQQKGRWLAVLDNFDNPKNFEKNDIRHYIPNAENGSILFTSRNEISERLGYAIRVTEMSEGESLDLLLQRPVANATERSQGLEIAIMLGHLALALDQAGAYIRARNLPLQEFKPLYNRRKKLVLQEIPEVWEYGRKLGETENETLLSVFVTFELSLEQISGTNKDKDQKKQFLTLSSYFDNKCISERYFEAYCRLEKVEWMQIFMTEDK